MPSRAETASHCLVRWEDDANQFAVVDTKRSKTVFSLKIGLTTCFEGFQRERRRGTILFLGSKKDCCVYGLDIAGDDGHVNMYQWSLPPGLQEQSEEIAQSLRQGTCSFKRTISAMSSSSSNSTTTTGSKHKKKMHKNTNSHDDEPATKDKSMPPPPLVSSITICDTSDNGVNLSQQSNSMIRDQSSAIITVACSATNSTTIPSTDIDSALDEIKVLREKLASMDRVVVENKKLREKILSTENEIFYLRDTLISLPDEPTYKYLKLIIDTYEQRKAELSDKVVELGKKLPCSNIELKQAKSANSSRTINNLIKYCYKGIDLKGQSYTKLKAKNPELMNNIYEYVQYVHAPKIITQSEFSSAISLRSRHLVDQDKHKTNSLTSSNEKENQNHSKNKNGTSVQKNSSSHGEVFIESFDSD